MLPTGKITVSDAILRCIKKLREPGITPINMPVIVRKFDNGPVLVKRTDDRHPCPCAPSKKVICDLDARDKFAGLFHFDWNAGFGRLAFSKSWAMRVSSVSTAIQFRQR